MQPQLDMTYDSSYDYHLIFTKINQGFCFIRHLDNIILMPYTPERHNRVNNRRRPMTNDQWQPIEEAMDSPWKQILMDSPWKQILAWPILVSNKDTRVGSCSASFAKMSGATHWMPLPKAPTDNNTGE
jgi:hypothetical protein